MKIAVDFGGTNIRAGIVKKGEIKNLVKKKTFAKKGKKKVLSQLVSTIKEVADGKKIDAIGLACPGPLKNNKIVNPPNLPWKRLDIKKFLKKKFKTKIEVERDANCAALAEAKLGRKFNNFIMLTLGTGIGGSIIINGELYKGKGYGGELGHIILDDGKDFEYHASGKAIRRYTKEILGEEKKYIGELYKVKDKRINKVLKKETEYLGMGIASIIHAFDPGAIILSGGFKDAGGKLIKAVRKEVSKRVMFPEKTKILWSILKEPGLLGANLLI